ncbi:MAG: hypothetical protein IPJ94_00020 [Chloroflexi bacterium]|nr:hypothetical protein [Chloroflexota bacterium]
MMLGNWESYANEHIGERVRVRGEVFNILDGAYQVWVDKGNYDVVSILVGFDEDTDMRVGRIYEDDVITVYGMVLGEIDGTNSFGSSISNALVFAERIENNENYERTRTSA